MKNVRIWFKKEGLSKYISHLDLNKVMTLAFNRSKIPIWHTEGFNPHPFITFALPLSLGFAGECETMDIRLLEENFNLSFIPEILNKGLPEGISVYKAAEPVMKPADISLANYEICLSCDSQSPLQLSDEFNELLGNEAVITQKKTKKGIKDIDLKPYLTDYSLTTASDGVLFAITLPAGSRENINPILYLNALKNKTGREYYYCAVRKRIMNSEGIDFE